jgi:hypothetical protein
MQHFLCQKPCFGKATGFQFHLRVANISCVQHGKIKSTAFPIEQNSYNNNYATPLREGPTPY